MTHADLVLGYDVGTSAVKAALFDAAGEMHAVGRATYPTAFPRPGYAEQDPYDWWRALAAATREALGGLPGGRERVAAIGIAAQVCGTVAAGADGAPLRPCLTWQDTRSARIAREITAGGPRIAGYGVWRLAGWLLLANGAPNLSGRDPLSKILWLREVEPETWRRAVRFLDVKDWLLHRCTGAFVTTPDVAQLTWLMDNRAGRRDWSDRYLRRFGLDRARLPAIVGCSARAGTLTPSAAADLGLAAGLPVTGGVSDVNANALAAGDYAEGAYHLALGTSMCLGTHSRTRRVAVTSSIGTLCAAHDDRYLLVASQENAGAALLWAADAFGFGTGSAGVRALDAAAAPVAPGADTPLFMPWLYGERVPVDDERLRGGVAGASLRTSRGELAYAVLAGVALNARWALDAAQRCLPSDGSLLRLCGGGAQSPVWTRVVADMLQQPLQLVAEPAFSGARGAAMTAAVVAGWFARVEDARGMARGGAVAEPDRARRNWADERYEQLVEYARALRRRRHRSGPGAGPHTRSAGEHA